MMNQVLLLSLLALLFAVACADLDASSFTATVLEDDKVWLVEFYSSMCGGCTEFAPTWDRVAAALPGVKTGKINIDNKTGMKIAEDLGVLDDGVPHVRIFSKRNSIKGSPLVKSDSSMTAEQIIQRVRKATSPLGSNADGFSLKK
mmetsp:Transcript_29579/g.65584  ORF Transcript_29579/g.65584 Transcript_29579/m.65584 type:complete len:145 (+) Transcript_29579:26-460(+)